MTKIVKKTFIVCLGICIALLLSIFFSAGVNAFAATTQEETNISAEQSETESDTTDEGTTEEEPLATVRQWTGDADDAGKAEYFAENGRDGIVFNSK